MHKIKIISNGPIIKPKTFDNIDVSLGVSYYSSNDKKLKVIENNWSFKVISKISQITKVFSSDLFSNKEIIDQILEDSDFLIKHHPENANNLEIQINQKTVTSKVINYLTVFDMLKGFKFFNKENKEKKLKEVENILSAVSENEASMYMFRKKMFLGTGVFEEKNKMYKNLSEKLTKKEAVSFVFFHEYSHAAQLSNNVKYQSKNNPLNNFENNILFLADIEIYNKFYEKMKPEMGEDFILSVPTYNMIKTLATLHQEIYADISSLLLMRNKTILTGNYNEKNFKEIVNQIDKVRKENKKDISNHFEEQQLDSVMNNSHFTSPSIESLLDMLNKQIKGEKNKVLSEKEIHEISYQCIKIGVGKTVLSMLETEDNLEKSFNILFSLKVLIKNNVEYEFHVNPNKNYFLESIKEIKEIVSKKWQENFKNNLQKIKEAGLVKYELSSKNLIFNAGLDYETFNKKIVAYDKKLEKFKIKDINCDKSGLLLETRVEIKNAEAEVKSGKIFQETTGITDGDLFIDMDFDMDLLNKKIKEKNTDDHKKPEVDYEETPVLFLAKSKMEIKNQIESIRKQRVQEHNTLKMK